MPNRAGVLFKKYRPTDLDGVKGNEGIIDALKSISQTLRDRAAERQKLQGNSTAKAVQGRSAQPEAQNYLNLILCGPHGVGKSVAAEGYAKALYASGSPDKGSFHRQMKIEINANEECNRNADNIAERIKIFVTTQSLASWVPGLRGVQKLVVLDHAHMLGDLVQNRLMHLMDEHQDKAHFLLIFPNGAVIAEGFTRRASILRFRPVPDEKVLELIHDVVKQENMKITEEAMDSLATTAGGDVRKALNNLQTAKMFQSGEGSDKTLQATDIRKIVGMASAEDMAKLVRKLLKSPLMEGTAAVQEFLDKQWISFGDLLEALHDTISNHDLGWPYSAKEPALFTGTEKSELCGDLGDLQWNASQGMREEMLVLGLAGLFVKAAQRRSRRRLNARIVADEKGWETTMIEKYGQNWRQLLCDGKLKLECLMAELKGEPEEGA